MDHKDKSFLPFYVKAGKFDWIKLERFGKLETIIQFYENQRDKNEKGEFIKNEDKWISTQIKTSRNGKMYEELVQFEKKDEVKAKEHLPDRVEEDLPF